MAPLIEESFPGAGDQKATGPEDPWEATESSPAFSTFGRSINELIESHATLLECQPTTCLFVCECEYGDCQGQIEMTLERYRLIREDSSLFMIVAGHESADDLVARREGSMLIVKKSERSEGSARNGRPTWKVGGSDETLAGDS
ncbi:MAG TPA: hypothetical protein VHJ40_05265 [Actinomycetota bacterium]|nr:hypothetical protein [Actinomycetota bacterium]